MPEERLISEFVDGRNVAKAETTSLPEKLLLELSAAQENLRYQTEAIGGTGAERQLSGEAATVSPAAKPAKPRAFSRLPAAPSSISHVLGRAGRYLHAQALNASGAARHLARRLRPADWRRRYLTMLSLLHRHIFDRRIERLLFFKTVYPERYSEVLDGGLKAFRYQGPFPGEVLTWALSALPSDLKRYAFVDFRAGNGRTLLLASRRNFEHAAGYAFDESTCEILEMNLAQYSRSYMSCRDVRALRAGRDGVAIPEQPAVLFFPHGLKASHLAVILNHVSTSLAAYPRPVYLIFEGAGPDRGLDQMQNFEKASLPLMNRIKIALFSPVLVSVYKSVHAANASG